MNQVCTTCERFSTDGNLWCERATCPLDELHPIFDYGEQFGEFKIIRLVRLLPTAMLYEAEHQDTAVLLKVAHHGKDDFIKREAAFAVKLVGRAGGFLRLRPAYRASTVANHPYGKAVFDRTTYYYTVYEHTQGEFLEDMLIKNPLPWYRDAAWIVMETARSLAVLHQQGSIIQAASLRSALLIRYDHNKIPRPTLVDLGWMLPINTAMPATHAEMAGRPPELNSTTGKASPATDVYGLARLLTEMLSGRTKPESDTAHIEGEVTLMDALNRADLPQSAKVGTILRQALAPDPRQRQQSVQEFAAQLVAIFGKPPPYSAPTILNKLTRKADWGTVAFGGMLAFLLFIIVILAVNR